MTDAKQFPRRTAKALHAVNKREKKSNIPALWPDENGALELKGVGVEKPTQLSTLGHAEPNGLPLPRLQQPRRARRKKTPQPQLSSSCASWRGLKSLDICSFNQGAELYFVGWLTEKIETADYNAVSLGWVISNAAFELDISTETAKRYIIKHTADKAEFYSDGKVITLRKKN